MKWKELLSITSVSPQHRVMNMLLVAENRQHYANYKVTKITFVTDKII